MVISVKFWMENANVANSLFLILKIVDVACQLKLKKKKKKITVFFLFPFFHSNFLHISYYHIA
jgi:hypothetical protein